VQGTHLSVDGGFIEANAAKESQIPREQLAEAAQVHHTVRQYLREVEEQNPVEEPVREQDRVSSGTDLLPENRCFMRLGPCSLSVGLLPSVVGVVLFHGCG
jgi:hypothetical protein